MIAVDAPVLIELLTDGPRAAADLKSIRSFIHDKDPVLVGVGAGGDLLTSAGFRPQVLIGRADDLSDQAVGRAAAVAGGVDGSFVDD